MVGIFPAHNFGRTRVVGHSPFLLRISGIKEKMWSVFLFSKFLGFVRNIWHHFFSFCERFSENCFRDESFVRLQGPEKAGDG